MERTEKKDPVQIVQSLFVFIFIEKLNSCFSFRSCINNLRWHIRIFSREVISKHLSKFISLFIISIFIFPHSSGIQFFIRNIWTACRVIYVENIVMFKDLVILDFLNFLLKN